MVILWADTHTKKNPAARAIPSQEWAKWAKTVHHHDLQLAYLDDLAHFLDHTPSPGEKCAIAYRLDRVVGRAACHCTGTIRLLLMTKLISEKTEVAHMPEDLAGKVALVTGAEWQGALSDVDL